MKCRIGMPFQSILLAIIAMTLFLCVNTQSALAAPVLESASPKYGPPGTIIQLLGQDLAGPGTPTVTICGQDAGQVTIQSAEQVDVQSPNHPMGIHQACDIIFTNNDGQSALEDVYTYYEPPPLQVNGRDFLMGFVPILLGPTDDPVRLMWYWNDARLIASEYGDIVSLLDGVWTDCNGGTPTLKDLAPAIDMVRWMHEKGVQVMLGLETTTQVRTNVGFCPGDTFAESHVVRDIEAQVRYLFEAQGPGPGEINYPEYLLLGMEMNMYYIANPDDWVNYEALMDNLYQVVREYTNKTKVVVSFQHDVLTVRGHQPWDRSYPRQWEIFGDLAIDVIGVSAYQGAERFFCSWDPYMMFDDKFQPYIDPANNPRGLPIAITETGYPAKQKKVLANIVNIYCGSELHQHSFLVRLAELLQQTPTEFMIWWSLHEGAEEYSMGLFNSMRLVTQDRECYPDCLPSDGDCKPLCPLDPKGTMAFDTWQQLFALGPSAPDDDDDYTEDDDDDDDVMDDDDDNNDSADEDSSDDDVNDGDDDDDSGIITGGDDSEEDGGCCR